MEHFEEHTAEAIGFALDETRQFIEPELQADDFSPNPEESEGTLTDDPVRVYLREMGSVSLLTRQAEVELARRMERGTLRIQKALSRSPVIRRNILAKYEEVRQSQLPLEDFVDIRGEDEA